jgi:tRNA-dihydrouridine synthase
MITGTGTVFLLLYLLIVSLAMQKCSSLSNLFFKSINSPKFIAAPMVEHSSLPFRLLVRKHGADLAFTQMMHAKLFASNEKYRSNCSDWVNYNHVNGDHEMEENAYRLDRPIIVQFAGDDPDALVEAGRYIQDTVSAIDLNLGCPQKIAKRGNYGAFLLEQPELATQVLSKLVQELRCPITAKVRILSNEKQTLELCKRFEGCGISMLTVHGRVKTSLKQQTGEADWDIIRKVKCALTIPVVANGGIECYDDAVRCLEHTGADAVMSAEALLENPKLFSEEGDRLYRTEYVRSQLNTARELLELTDAYANPRCLEGSTRGHLFKILHRMLVAPANRDMLQALTSCPYAEMAGVLGTLSARFAAASAGAGAGAGAHTAPAEGELSEEKALELGLLVPTGYYLRHRKNKPK